MKVETKIRAAAALLAHCETPLLDARVLAKRALGVDDAALILEGERLLSADEAGKIDALIARRAAGESVAHIIGEKEFYGLTFKLARRVLAPRPDTETLIEAAMARRERAARLRILDLGTGSGCVLCALLTVFPNATGVGVDICEAAARLARANAAALGLGARADFLVGDWAAPLVGRFDIIVANPPYIRAASKEGLAPEIRDFEDPRALFAGADGLTAYEAILAGAPARLAPAGLMILELGEAQDAAVRRLAGAVFPAAAIEVNPDLAGRPRALMIDLSPQKSV